MAVDPQTELVSEIAALTVSIDRVTAAIGITLRRHRPASRDDDPRRRLAEHRELCRQLAALRQRVAEAQTRTDDPRALRSELATLLFFAKTLQADAGTWRAAIEAGTKELGRERATARRERERLAAEHAELVRRRDALRVAIDQAAARIARANRGDCRRTLPVFTLAEGVTLCSVTVSRPRRGLRCAKRWLVTLNDSHDEVLIRRE